MLWVKCLEKVRDKNNIITDYVIADLNGDQRTVTKDALKNAIASGQAAVVNLKLSKDGKLMDRSIEEQAALSEKLHLGVVTDKDTRMYNKAVIIDAAPTIDEHGFTVDWPESEKVYITPHVQCVMDHSCLPYKTLVFTGNNEIRLNVYRRIKKAIIMNPTMVHLVAERKLNAETIIFDFDNMDLKIIDIIFKTYKEEKPWESISSFNNILVSSNRIDCKSAYARAEQILKRQKPSSHNDRRCYDIVVYLRLIYSMYLSYNDKSILQLADKYIQEYDSKIERFTIDQSFARTLILMKTAVKELIQNIKDNK